MTEGRKHAVAFGFIPVWWDGEAFEGKNWLCEIALDVALVLTGLIPGALDNGVPLKVYEDDTA